MKKEGEDSKASYLMREKTKADTGSWMKKR